MTSVQIFFSAFAKYFILPFRSRFSNLFLALHKPAAQIQIHIITLDLCCLRLIFTLMCLLICQHFFCNRIHEFFYGKSLGFYRDLCIFFIQ